MAVVGFIKKQAEIAEPTSTQQKKVEGIIDSIRLKIEKAMVKKGITCEFFVGGSTAKGTWLYENKEIDIFLRIPREYGDLSKSAEEILKSAFLNVKKIHGSRDYFQIIYKSYTIEFIPVLLTSNIKKIDNQTDASPFHVDYINSMLNKSQKTDVRLLKRFCKSINVYGAESYISGFSGYVLEILTANYGSILDLFYSVEKWKPPIFIDIKGKYGGLVNARKKLGTEKTKSSIVIIDPVIETRNAAASISDKKLAKFIFSVRMFLESPVSNYFSNSNKTIKDIKKTVKKRGTELHYFKIKLPENTNTDIFLSKVKKNLNKLLKEVESEGFKAYDSGFFIEESCVVCWFEFEIFSVPKTKKHKGPLVWAEDEHFFGFINKWRKEKGAFGPYLENDRIVFDKKREHSSLEDFFETTRKKYFPMKKK